MNTSHFNQKNNLIAIKDRRYNGILDDNGIWVTVDNGKLRFCANTIQPDPMNGKEWVKVRYEDAILLKNAGKRKECRKLINKKNGKIYYVRPQDVGVAIDINTQFYQDKACTMQINLNQATRHNLLDLRQGSRMQNHTREFDCNTYRNLTDNYHGNHGFNADHVLALKQLGNYCINIRNALGLQPNNITNLNDPVIINAVNNLFGHQVNLGQNNIVRFALQNTNADLINMASDHNSDLARMGVTIAINNRNYHQTFSPTYGGRQRKRDRIGINPAARRPVIDGDLRTVSTAIHRDIKSVYQGISQGLTLNLANQNDNQVRINHNNLVKSLGAYRRLYNKNIKDEVFNISSNAYSYNQNPLNQGVLTYTPKNNLTSGKKTDLFMIRRIKELCGIRQDDIALDQFFI